MKSTIEQFNELMGDRSYLFVGEEDAFEVLIDKKCASNLVANAGSTKGRLWLERNLIKLYWFMICEVCVHKHFLELESGMLKENLRMRLRYIGGEGITRFVPSEFSRAEKTMEKENTQRVLCVFEKDGDERSYRRILYEADDCLIRWLPDKVVQMISPEFYRELLIKEKVFVETE